jgi:uncharacterized protein YpuA (DUF1002 family)
MSKRNRQKRKLRKLIQERMREIQTQPVNQLTDNRKQLTEETQKQTEIETPETHINKLTRKEKIENQEHSEQDVARIHPDFKKIAIISGILAIIFVGIYFVNLKTPLLNNLANKLYTVFQNS